MGTLEEALAPDAPLVHDGPICARACSTAWARCRRATATSATATRIDRGDVDARLRGRGHRGRGRLHVPGRLPVRDGDPQRHRPGGRTAGSRCGRPASTRSWCAPRSRRCSTCRWAGCASSCPTWAAASAASRTPRWSPSRSPSRARRVAPCGSSTASSESMVTTRRHGARIRMRTAADARRPAPGARGAPSTSTPAPTPTTGRA